MEEALKALQALARAKKSYRTADATHKRRQRAADQIYVNALRARDEDMTTARETIMRITFEATTARKQAEDAIEDADEETKPKLQTPEAAHKAVLIAHKAELDEAEATVASIREEAEHQKTAFVEPFYAKLQRARAREEKALKVIDALTEPVKKANSK